MWENLWRNLDSTLERLLQKVEGFLKFTVAKQGKTPSLVFQRKHLVGNELLLRDDRDERLEVSHYRQ